MQTTFRLLLDRAREELEAAGVNDAALDAGLLAEEYLGLSRARYLMDADRPQQIDEDAIGRFFSAVDRRASHVPLQYILGWTSFMGLKFSVDSRVLIPRQDTETLVEAVLAWAADKKALTLLDLCTGSGCIAVSLAALGHFESVTACDISEDALAAARENAQLNQVDIHFRQGDLFSAADGRFDVITANPPYIPKPVLDSLMPEVRDFEPRCALDGGEDGLVFYRRIAEQALNRLKPGGALFLEIGYDQAEDVTALLRGHGFAGTRVIRDLAGHDRVVTGQREYDV